MSGGHFDYKQYQISDIVESIRFIIRNNDLPDAYHYSDEVISEFKKGIKILQQASVYAQRIDWLVSGDDDEGSFFERLKEELQSIEYTMPIRLTPNNSRNLLWLMIYT